MGLRGTVMLDWFNWQQKRALQIQAGHSRTELKAKKHQFKLVPLISVYVDETVH